MNFDEPWSFVTDLDEEFKEYMFNGGRLAVSNYNEDLKERKL